MVKARMRTKPIRRQKVYFLLLTLSVILVNITVVASASPSGEAYIYSYYQSPSSEALLSYLNNEYEWKVTNYNLNNSVYSDEFCKIVSKLAREGVEVVPSEACTSCLLLHHTWEEIYLMFASPIIGFFRNGRLTAITIAITDYRVLDQALMVDLMDGVKVFTHYSDKTFTLTDEDARIRLEEGFLLRQEEDVHININYLLPLIVTAAAVDVINPCEFYVLIVFLSLVFSRSGRKAVLKAGMAFSIAIFIIYYLMGFGLLKLITYAQEARFLILILGFSVGLRAVLNFAFGVFGLSLGLRDTIGSLLNRKFKRVPEFFSKRLSGYLRKASENPMVAFAIGVVASVFLLPCTSGPYLIALSLMANLETLFEGLFLLTVYNSIIMTPFLVITLGIYTLKLRTGELKRWSSRKQMWLNLVAGLSMIFLSLYLLCEIIL